MTAESNLSRRTFLASSVVAAAPAIIPSGVFGNANQAAPSDRIRLGVIGIGPRCTYDLQAMLPQKDVECVAIADVQLSRREAGKTLVDKHYGNDRCKLYGDFRALLDRSDIDAVLVATGDRWHAAASILAAQAGKDVYSEKPCGITIELCEKLADTMKETGRIFQAGTQRRSVPNFQQAVRIAHEGKLGKLRTLYASVYVPVLENAWLPAEPTPSAEVCDWNMWLGPAPWRPYNSKYVAGRWRGYYDFDSGARLLDWGAHTADLCQWANQSDGSMPLTYEPTEKNITCTYANGVQLVFDFLEDPFGDRGPRWNTKLGTCPVRFVGDDGSIETGDNGGTDVSSSEIEKELAEAASKVRGLDVSAHARNFFDSIKSRKPTVANAEVMRNSHITCHAAALAWMLGRSLTIDPITHDFLNDDEANRLKSRPERDWA
ncbi:MAG: Gfo/Idh/MocA family oxidoreductase [Planctomycetaceae bacterium]|nr:Gfo/Idh/MocA family oxidoreductase [Planctomycetaceae bacterium]